MKRRNFVKNLGKGISSSMLLPPYLKRQKSQGIGEYTYPHPESLEDAKNSEGHLAVRVEIQGKSKELKSRLTGRFVAKKGSFHRIRNYLLLGTNSIDLSNGRFDLSIYEKATHHLAFWIEKASVDTRIECRNQIGDISLEMSALIQQPEFIHENDDFILKANLLLYHETGFIDIGETLNIKNQDENFRFVIMADPQGGDPEDKTNDSTTRVKIHNAFIEESIEAANELNPSSLFTFILGDLTDSKGQRSNFNKMIGFYEKLKNPVLLEIGNHETRYGARFTPGYNMSEFDNYFAAQKQINGLEKLLYSFDVGRWHFIVWPDPLRGNFWNTHPHYFDWLERDLEANKDKPVFFFQHVPVHPIGINPLVSYVNDIHVNRLLFDILSRHGNVKYVFSGHVHIPIRSSNKTAVDYRGIRMINLPPTGYRPRAFGEPDLYGGPSQGITIVDVDQEKVDISYKTVTRKTFHYPHKFSAYKKEDDPLWFKYKWELDAVDKLENGNFEEGLKFWYKKYVYTEDQNPSNICEVRAMPETGKQGLYLYSRKRDYDKPGQDRLPQTNNQVSQVIRTTPGMVPSVKFSFYIEEQNFHPESWNGAFMWFEAYSDMHLRASLLYSIGRAHRSVGGSYGAAVRTSFFDITDTPGRWHDVILNINEDLERSNGAISLLDLDVDKYVINLGTWTINDGHEQEIGVNISNIEMESTFPDHTGQSRLDNKQVKELGEKNIWREGIDHIAGEHIYASQNDLYPY